MGLTFAYMPPRTYTRLAESTCRLEADPTCEHRRPDVLRERRRTRQSCVCGRCGHPCSALCVACMQRCVGAVCGQPCRLRRSPCKYSPISLAGDYLARCLMHLPAAGTGSIKQIHEFTATAAPCRGRDGRAPLLWYGCKGLSACLPVSTRVDSVVSRQPRRPTATARRNGHGAGRASTSSSVLRRSKCERENKARYGQACIER